MLEDSDIEDYADEDVEQMAEQRVRKEIKDAVQTMQYQWSTLSSTNGVD